MTPSKQCPPVSATRTLFHLLTLLLLLGLAAPSLARECAFSETKLRSQSDVDEFQLNFLTQTPWVRCTVLVGSLVVEQEPGAGDDFEDPITSLAGLDDIVEVRGQLAIVGNPRLESLEGLENLRRVDGRFGVAHNRALKNLDALSALELVTDLNVGFNRELTNLDGLTGLRLDPDVDHSLVIEGNPRLQSVAGLAGLRGELRWLWITSNDQLDSFAGFEGITQVAQLGLSHNGAQAQLDAFSSLTRVVSLRLAGMDSLRDLDALSGRLAGLRWLELSDNPALVDLGALRTLEPRALVGLWVLHNSSLKNLDALSGKLYPAGDAIVIEGNAALEQIDGLRGVGASSAYDRVAIVDNPSLTNLEGLSELRQIQGFSQIGLKFSGDLEVTGNTSLVDCSALGKVLGAPARPHDEDTDNVFRFVTIDETNGIGAQSPDDCLEAYTQRPPITLPDIRRATHGSWYDPLTTGEGLMLFTAPNGRLSLYYFGYTDDGEQQWLVAFSDDAPRWGEPVEFDVFSTSGGSFNDFDPSKVETVPWGSITLRLISCEVGELLMQGPSGTKWMTLTRLADTVGSPCNANGDRPPSATGSLTGAWYEPATDGQGFAVHHVSGDRGMVYFFGYRDDGADLWLVGVWDQPLRFGETLEMDVQVFTGGAYVYFEPGDIVSEVWGTLTLRFDDCDRGEAILEGQEGRQALDLQLLAGALGLACG